MAVQRHIRDLRLYPPDQIIPQHPFLLRPLFHMLMRPSGCSGHPHDPGHILRAGTPASLLLPAVDKRTDSRLFPYIKKPRALRPVKFVRTGRKQVDMIFLHRQRQMPIRLHRIGVEQNTMCRRDLPDLLHRLDRPHLVVGRHHGDQDRIRPDRPFKLSGIHQPFGIHIQISDPGSHFLQIFTRMQHRMMLDPRGDNMPALILPRLEHRLQRPVIRLRSARRKIDLIRLGPQRPGDRLSGPQKCLPALTRKAVYTARISIIFRKIRQHSLHHLRRRPGGGRVIQINHLSSVLSYPPATAAAPPYPEAPPPSAPAAAPHPSRSRRTSYTASETSAHP